MSEQRVNDGGAAFPLQCADGCVYPGMTLRDYFAAHALQGMLASETEQSGLCHGKDGDDNFIPNNAKRAYQWADAMLAAREVE